MGPRNGLVYLLGVVPLSLGQHLGSHVPKIIQRLSTLRNEKMHFGHHAHSGQHTQVKGAYEEAGRGGGRVGRQQHLTVPVYPVLMTDGICDFGTSLLMPKSACATNGGSAMRNKVCIGTSMWQGALIFHIPISGQCSLQ